MIGLKKLNTTDPEYISGLNGFSLKMYEVGLAYEAFTDDWCPLMTGLTYNEEVVHGKCDRCGMEVDKKNSSMDAENYGLCRISFRRNRKIRLA